jgi:dihydroorotase
MKKTNYRTTGITVNKATDIKMKEKGMKPTYIVNNALEWHDRLIEQNRELKELREFKSTADIKIRRLQEENIDLLRFKNKVLEKIRKEENSRNPPGP